MKLSGIKKLMPATAEMKRHKINVWPQLKLIRKVKEISIPWPFCFITQVQSHNRGFFTIIIPNRTFLWLQLTCYFDYFEYLNLITFGNVIVVFQHKAAFKALAHFFDIVFKAFQ